jgi:hypothetical protein
MRLVQRLMEVSSGQANPLDVSRREEAVAIVDQAREVVRALDEDAGSPAVQQLAPLLRMTMRHQTRLITAMQRAGDTGDAARHKMRDVHAAVARVVLTFPPRVGEISEVAQRAEKVKQFLLSVDAAITTAARAERDPLSDADVKRSAQVSNDAEKEFARLANAEICKRRWPLDV